MTTTCRHLREVEIDTELENDPLGDDGLSTIDYADEDGGGDKDD